ncbi:centrosomal protein of 126 kDa [Triplophysa rosa]|uniref:Centrosomal protein of 126 kDa n=1 Tax=Triplophysa rosa TaxID=992332 RepID=A0A9W7TU82_TRIRA|nr:centrosomal protein of 126 kDa [Triplophysa rosa]KAI7802746.1 hypothetical protein IRJ41_018351 [Triplophysa rosa]
MPALKDKLYYSNIRLGLHEDTEDDRKLLVQEQKYCRSRSRKLTLETNRRRRALEEKRKQWDFQEQRLRENILQQRRQKVQDATENFQRAHLPPSQRKRTAFRGRAPNLDQALHHIQGTSRLYTHQSPFLSCAFTISRSCTPSPKPPGGARHLRALSAAEAYNKLMQEKSIKNNQLLFLTEQQLIQSVLKEKEQTSPQEYLDTPHSETESLSSLDSLENGGPQQSHGTTSVHCSKLVHSFHQNTCTQSSWHLVDPFQDPKNSPSPPGQSTFNLSSSPQPSCSVVKSFLEEVLIQERNFSSISPSPRAHESAEVNKSLQNLTQATEQCNLTDQSQSFDTQSTLRYQRELIQQDLAANSEHMTHYNDRNAQGNILKDKETAVAHCKTQTVPVTTPLEFSNLPEEFKSESKLQTKTLEEKYSKHSSEWQTSVSASRSKHSFFETTSDHDAHSRTDRISDVQPLETQSSSRSHKHKPDVDIASGFKRESKPLTMEESATRDLQNPKKESEITKEEPDRTSAEPMTHPAPNSSNARFLKGILKNYLKTKSGNVKFTYTPNHLLFTKEVAILIRDSVELARAKLNEPEHNRTIKKKLRWFDEVNGIEGAAVDGIFKDPNKQPAAKSGHANSPQQTRKQFSADQGSYYVNLLSGVSKNISSKTSSAPAGPQSTRQAWADVGPQENHTQEHVREPTSQKGGCCVWGPRAPRRARSARPGPGSITSRARKGTIIRPQSAREAQHVAKTQGKMLVPRPPPKPDVVECDFADISKAVNYNIQSQPGAQMEQVLCRDNPDSQATAHQPVLKADAVCVPVPPYYTYTHESVSKDVCSLSPPVENAERRCGENGICLDRTPTDEEITLLWHGVRSALASKEGDPQSFLAHNGPLSAPPQACASLSHVTINGDSLISGVKGVSKMDGFFLSSSNMRNPIRRQMMESNMVKNRATADGSRIQTAGTVQRKNYLSYQVTVPRAPHPDKNQAAVNGEVTDGEHDPRDWVQSHKTCNAPIGPHSQRMQSLNISALTLEEQKILQSLERLNQRLQYVRDTAGGNPAVKGIFASAPGFNQTGENVGVAVRRRGVSADNRTQTQQRYGLHLP